MTWDRLHDEDVLFEYRGQSADDLVPGRFYRGTVDGFADFGVFVTIGDSVTGLLHRSNIPGRLESLDWDAGDEVIVQVEGVRDNGNIDLDWSIRQSPREFRGADVHDPDGSAPPEEPTPQEHAPQAPSPEEQPTQEQPAQGSPPEAQPPQEPSPQESPDEEPTTRGEPAPEPDEGQEATTVTQQIQRIETTEAESAVGSRVRLAGRIEDIRQTNGPTIFRLADPAGSIDCAGFESAGVRAFPEISVGDVVAAVGRIERHRGSLQLETESMDVLPTEEAEEIETRITEAALARARPEDTSILVPDDTVDPERIAEMATQLRRHVLDRRSIVIRHPATVDGIVAAAAIERAVRTLAEASLPPGEAGSWFVTRRPLEDTWFDLGDAMYDVTDAGERDDVFVLVGVGAADRDAPATSLLDVYGMDHLVVDQLALDAPIAVLATNLAAMVEASVREELVHLPAIAVGYDLPAQLGELAASHGYDAETIRERHEAIALVAYYQRYDDKRELIADLLFDGESAGNLARHVSEQFRERLDDAVHIAEQNATMRELQGATVLDLDAASLTHRFSFPPRSLLGDALYRRTGADVVVLLDEDEAFVAGAGSFDLDRLAGAVNAAVENAAVEAARDRLSFLAGKREAVREALIEAIVEPQVR